ncbi:MAG: RnfABCDGE type electron transport complex subunit D [Candidatus Aenigmarchaeota archaeon]|nr:RnfABCDGE type electron transport complex subunit D [Candidatus Aenigmarchaeota archaeon]
MDLQPANAPPKPNLLTSLKTRYARITIYQQMIILLSLLVLINSANLGSQLLVNTTVTLASVFVFHYVISKLRKKEQISYESVTITGLLIALILMPGELYALAFASLVAVLSKRIKFNNRHVVNPAMSGIFAAVLLTNSSDSWLGASQLLPVLVFGLLIAQKYRRLHLVIPFILTHTALSVAHRFYYNMHPVYQDVFGGLIYFLAFFMLLEPKTTPIRPNARTAYGIISAVIIFALSLAMPKYAITGGLLLCNLLVQPIEKIVK